FLSHTQKKPRGPAPAYCTTRVSAPHDGQSAFFVPSPLFSAVFAFFSAIVTVPGQGRTSFYTSASAGCQGARVGLSASGGHANAPPARRVHLQPQGRPVEIAGRRPVGRLLAELGVLPGTAMVIRGDVLLLDGEMLEDEDDVEVRAVISGGAA